MHDACFDKNFQLLVVYGKADEFAWKIITQLALLLSKFYVNDYSCNETLEKITQFWLAKSSEVQVLHQCKK